MNITPEAITILPILKIVAVFLAIDVAAIIFGLSDGWH